VDYLESAATAGNTSRCGVSVGWAAGGSRPISVSWPSPNRSVGCKESLRTGVLISGRSRLHTNGHLQPLAGALGWTFERRLRGQFPPLPLRSARHVRRAQPLRRSRCTSNGTTSNATKPNANLSTNNNAAPVYSWNAINAANATRVNADLGAPLPTAKK